MKPKVYIAVLSLAEIRKELSVKLIEMSHDSRFQLKITYPGLRPISLNRNNIVKEFLKTDCNYLLMLDNDTVPLKSPLDLVLLEKDIIGLLYPQIKGDEIGWLAMNQEGDRYRQIDTVNQNGLIECDAIGTGCILIARRVLEKVKIPFERKWKDGVPIKGLDFYFCDKAKRLGFKVWVHLDYICSHFKTIDLLLILELLGGNDGK